LTSDCGGSRCVAVVFELQELRIWCDKKDIFDSSHLGLVF